MILFKSGKIFFHVTLSDWLPVQKVWKSFVELHICVLDFTEMKSEKYLTIYLVSKLFRVSSIFGNYEVIHLHQFCIKQTMASGYQVKPKKSRWKFSGMACLAKKYRFSRISVLLWWNNPSACCGGNFDATDFYIAHLNQGTQIDDLVSNVSTVWPPAPLKVRRDRFVSHQKGHL